MIKYGESLKNSMVHQHACEEIDVVEILFCKEQTKFGFIDKNAVKLEIDGAF